MSSKEINEETLDMIKGVITHGRDAGVEKLTVTFEVQGYLTKHVVSHVAITATYIAEISP